MKLSPTLGTSYLAYLYDATPGAGSRCDLVAYFLRQGFALLRSGGALGLVCTNTIAQGDTRTGGLEWLTRNDGYIYAATRRLKWPGQAAVVVAILHIAKSFKPARLVLDDRAVLKITPFLFPIGGESSPVRLSENADQCFIGNNLLGMGFTFDDQSSAATPLSMMRDIVAKHPECGKLILPFIGGEEIATSPKQQHHRYVINFGDMDLKAARQYRPLLSIVEDRVLPGRRNKKGAYATKWWQFGRRNIAGQRALRKVQRALVSCQVSPFLSWAFQSADKVFAHTLSIVAVDTHAAFCALQSRPHEIWARFFGSSMKDDLRYTPSDCFETFPFPENWETHAALEAAGKAYYEFRAALMVRNNEGLTKTYNRFHHPDEEGPDILKLRELHATMDRAVLDAYGWIDIPTDCKFLLDYEIDEEEWGNKKKPWRYRWPDEVRDEVLARLLELNAERAKEEARSGIAVTGEPGGKPEVKRAPKAAESRDLF